jgi:hypothetical protein
MDPRTEEQVRAAERAQADRDAGGIVNFHDTRSARAESTRAETDVERLTREAKEEEEAALDVLEVQENERKRKEVRDALRPHAREEIARQRAARGAESPARGNETREEVEARHARERAQFEGRADTTREQNAFPNNDWAKDRMDPTTAGAQAERDARDARYGETPAERDARERGERGS